MPAQAGPSLVYASLPSFTPVFGDSVNCASNNSQHPQDERPLYTQSLIPPQNSGFTSASEHPISFAYRGSVSSSGISDSTDSSPTTTISTFDTPSVTDTSPSSSPDSPSSLSVSYTKLNRLPDITERITMQSDTALPSLAPLPTMISSSTRSTSPGRRARNLKNLSLKMPYHTPQPSISTASVVESTSQNYSAPPSPVLRPAKTARRKPANLTIRTPASDQTSFAANIADIIPPTPSTQQRPLRHFESSPSLSSLFSPTTAPLNGMQLPRPTTQDGTPLMPGSWQDSPPSTRRPSQVGSLQQVAEEDDYNLDSRESTKRTEKSYPDGPIKIYDSGVYLYLEPTMEEASKFDVVVNVAKEVVNPFADEMDCKADTVISTIRHPVSLAKRLSIAEPMTAISEESFHSAFECLPSELDNSTAKVEKTSTPEYLHVPWDHNSEILEDLIPLCQLIDDRINQGKSVLIHCQLGASRSASLVIAYGLYKNRDLDFSGMYSVVKSKSRWVGPNMSLIYQLTDFRSRMLRGEKSRPPNQDWFKIPSSSKPVQQDKVSDSSSKKEDPLHECPPQQEQVEQVEQPTKPVLSENIFSPIQTTFTSGSAKPAFPLQKQFAFGARNLITRPLPLREKYQSFMPTSQPNKNSEGRKVAHVRYPSVQMDLVMQDVPLSPSILSPRAAPFMSSSISRTLAGDLAGDGPSTLFEFDQPSLDPRSPPQRREVFIMRSIDEVL